MASKLQRGSHSMRARGRRTKLMMYLKIIMHSHWKQVLHEVGPAVVLPLPPE